MTVSFLKDYPNSWNAIYKHFLKFDILGLQIEMPSNIFFSRSKEHTWNNLDSRPGRLCVPTSDILLIVINVPAKHPGWGGGLSIEVIL